MNKDLFEKGYQHGLTSNKLVDFRLSFMLGFRKAKLELIEIRKKQGIVNFPLQGKIQIKNKEEL